MPSPLTADYAYFMIVGLMVIGLYGMLAKHNLMKKLIGMNIFQTGIILFFIAGSVKPGATIPIIDRDLGPVDPALYVNPLPHVLMLTAIVVAVALTGAALALLIAIYRRYGSLDERTLIEADEP